MPCLATDSLRRHNRDCERRGHGDKDQTLFAGIHEHTENQRRRRESNIGSRIHEPINSAERSLAQVCSRALPNQVVSIPYAGSAAPPLICRMGNFTNVPLTEILQNF